MSIWFDTKDSEPVEDYSNKTIDFWNAFLVTAKEWDLIEAALRWSQARRKKGSDDQTWADELSSEESLLAAIEQVEEERNRE